MAITRVHKSSLVQAIVKQIEGAIVDGTYDPGDKLPALQKLQKIVGASQGTLREALRILEQKGLLEIRLGIKGGAFVRESSTDSITEGLGLLILQRAISYQDIAEFRKTVEPGLIKLVIQNVSEKDVALLKENLLKMKAVASQGTEVWPVVLDLEVEIRKIFLRIANNKMYEAVLLPIFNNIISYARQLFQAKNCLPQDASSDWALIIKAIGEKNDKAAVETIIKHIDRYVDVVSPRENKGKI